MCELNHSKDDDPDQFVVLYSLQGISFHILSFARRQSDKRESAKCSMWSKETWLLHTKGTKCCPVATLC